MSKFFKNPDRNKQSIYTPYVPQYKVKGIEPVRSGQNAFGIQGQALIVNSPPSAKFTPKLSKPVNIPYAEVATPPPNTFKVPNVGNNIEAAWTSTDDEVIDDLDLVELDPNAPMIDNNDYYTGDFVMQQDTLPKMTVKENEVEEQQSLSDNVDLEEGQYLLAIDGTVISVGNIDDIQNEVRDLVFGDHELCSGQSINADDIVVLKRMKIKVGVFVNE